MSVKSIFEIVRKVKIGRLNEKKKSEKKRRQKKIVDKKWRINRVSIKKKERNYIA